MDRALQERTVGAIILVVFAVLVVPVFLDGPSSETGMISEPVTLPGQNQQERKTKTIVLKRDRNEPVPAPPGSAAAPKSSQGDASIELARKSQPAKRKPATTAKAEVAKSAKKTVAESTTGMWAVQLGSFSSQDNAEKLAADLRKQGFAAFLRELQTGSGALHRVRVGPQKDRDSAEAVAARLNNVGHSGQVVPHP